MEKQKHFFTFSYMYVLYISYYFSTESIFLYLSFFFLSSYHLQLQLLTANIYNYNINYL